MIDVLTPIEQKSPDPFYNYNIQMSLYRVGCWRLSSGIREHVRVCLV